jgi:hypothetical protein
MKLIKSIKGWFRVRRYKKMLELCTEFDLHPVTIIQIAGTDYIKHNDGSYRRIGGNRTKLNIN